jgi:hypothetical protein
MNGMASTTDRMRLEQEKALLLKERDLGYICQYTTMTEVGRKLSRIEKFYQLLLRAYPAVQRRIRRWGGKFFQKTDGGANGEITTKGSPPEDSSRDTLKIGDRVRVLSYSQIRSTLNDAGYFKGLPFQEPMKRYCGNTYSVLKIPQYLIDQGGRKINRCKDLVILRGLYCNGKGMVTHEGCDMCCLHYWKTDWLKKEV